MLGSGAGFEPGAVSIQDTEEKWGAAAACEVLRAGRALREVAHGAQDRRREGSAHGPRDRRRLAGPCALRPHLPGERPRSPRHLFPKEGEERAFWSGVMPTACSPVSPQRLRVSIA